MGAVVAQPEPLEAEQPGDAAFDDPTNPAEVAAGLDAAAGDADLDAAMVQVAAAARVVVALMGR
jgi:hypothetical protein